MNISRIKREKNKKVILLIIIALLCTLIFNDSFAKYQTTQSIDIVKGTINYKPYDFKVMAMYQKDAISDYEETDIMPKSGYKINEEKSYCTLDNINKDNDSKLYTLDSGEHVMEGLKKNSKCYIYFDKEICSTNSNVCKTILANKNIAVRTDFSKILESDTTGTIYGAYDDDGISYYYAGAPTDNYVKFAGYYWRIIRINGDGTLRMIYTGDASVIDEKTNKNEILANGYDDKNTNYTVLNKVVYNSNKYDTATVGYMYTLNEKHGLTISSNIKDGLDYWYMMRLANYSNYLSENTGFCGDREFRINNSGTISFNSYQRLYERKDPSLKCVNNLDLYTTVNSNKGNKALSYPIGLLTSDEIAYSGGVYWKENKKYYLFNGQNYWTMTPYLYYGQNYVFYLTTIGALDNTGTDSAFATRPVINLRSDITFKEGGLGTIESPYEVEEI